MIVRASKQSVLVREALESTRCGSTEFYFTDRNRLDGRLTIRRSEGEPSSFPLVLMVAPDGIQGKLCVTGLSMSKRRLEPDEALEVAISVVRLHPDWTDVAISTLDGRARIAIPVREGNLRSAITYLSDRAQEVLAGLADLARTNGSDEADGTEAEQAPAEPLDAGDRRARETATMQNGRLDD